MLTKNTRIPASPQDKQGFLDQSNPNVDEQNIASLPWLEPILDSSNGFLEDIIVASKSVFEIQHIYNPCMMLLENLS